MCSGESGLWPHTHKKRKRRYSPICLALSLVSGSCGKFSEVRYIWVYAYTTYILVYDNSVAVFELHITINTYRLIVLFHLHNALVYAHHAVTFEQHTLIC